MPKVKDKERTKEKTLKAAREKQRVTYKGVPIRFLKRNFAGKKGLARSIQSDEKLGPTT